MQPVSWNGLGNDGGVTWAVMWNETRTIDFPDYGTGAHTWVVDNLVVDNGPQLPTLTILGACPGPEEPSCSNMTPGGQVPIGFSYLPGLYTTPAGPCAGATVPLFSPTLKFTRIADPLGAVVINGSLPHFACGLVTLVASGRPQRQDASFLRHFWPTTPIYCRYSVRSGLL